mmetsp:Transcript_79079/g.137087  ORF Transcript_79079/g.137087 Transcript_79079/m.137087 type:complete len:176 (-) Transcript_79079:38-565(-)
MSSDHKAPLLHQATQKRDVKEVRRLIMKGVNVNRPDVDLYTPLHRACEISDAQIVKMLLDAGADPNVSHPGLDGWTPLHLAAWLDAVDCVKVLLEHGADVRALDWYGRTAADWAGSNSCSIITEAAKRLAPHVTKDQFAGLRGKSVPKSNAMHLDIIERCMREAEEFDRAKKSKL